MRCNNWPAKLALFVEEKRRQPFDWAHNNCCFFASDWLAMLTGQDPAADMRGEVTSAFSAQRALAVRGGVEQIADDTCAKRGWPECAVPLARRGDIVVSDMPEGPALGVCLGAQAVLPGATEVVFVSMARCRRAWRII